MLARQAAKVLQMEGTPVTVARLTKPAGSPDSLVERPGQASGTCQNLRLPEYRASHKRLEASERCRQKRGIESVGRPRW